jgi:uncharacterized protein DUF4345
MPIQDVLNIIGALSLLGYGIGSLLLPHPVAKLIAQVLTTPRGIAEFRIVNGGYFIGLAGFALIANQPLVYTALGIGWLGAASARVFAYLVDRPPFEPIYVGLLIFEIAAGVMLMV